MFCNTWPQVYSPYFRTNLCFVRCLLFCFSNNQSFNISDLDIPLNNLNPERVDDCIPGDENHQQDIQGCDVQETSCHLLTERGNKPPNKAFKEHSSDLYVECKKSENLCAGLELDDYNSEFVERDPVWIRLKPTDIDGSEEKSSGSKIRDLSLDSTYIPFPKYFRDFTEVVNKT